ncbi:hypothetical protein GCM10011352_01220 [Marinobacterium zhoushanense]|uniref:DUF4325 domain-containing protein n=1 Tax=Marinobacterium zhoushanense TaxID=1679163 RepID=A0ABQ1JVF3_9GAMM|nr:hypothetical protein [Marinobacterium zhoushanense]GGB79314.1 hypothetical protein GCM10011352_01220 [Marinobacterium zhoushanense]
MKIPIEIHSHNHNLGFEFIESKSLSSGASIVVPGDAKVEFQGALIRKSVGIPEVLQFIVDASVTIDLGLFSSWLYDKVKSSNVEKIVIRRREITEITAEGIRKVLEEEIESSK